MIKTNDKYPGGVIRKSKTIRDFAVHGHFLAVADSPEVCTLASVRHLLNYCPACIVQNM
nr:MAG TPA: hypothetical protein [Bacteriophage sp.]